MVGVVAIHCGLGYTGSAADKVSKLFSVIIPSSCVPLFFLISGFLFFWSIEKFDFAIYRKKLKSRWHTLVIPYLFWNTFMIVCYAAVHIFAPSMTSAENENVLQYSLLDWVTAYWNKSGGQPVAFQLWFLRNLIVMTFFAPVFYWFSKLPSFSCLLPLAGFFVLSKIDGFGWNCGCFYYYIGVLFSCRKELLQWVQNSIDLRNDAKKGMRACALGIVAVWLFLVNIRLFCMKNSMMDSAERFTGVCAFLIIAFYLTRRYGKMNAFFEKSGYFVYLFHAFPCFVVKKITELYFHPTSVLSWILLYICRLVFLLSICLIVYFLLCKCLPRTTAFITGKRVK